jgi:exopolysaccharide biosynthesis polyprenyl glycosylphosphotransferase
MRTRNGRNIQVLFIDFLSIVISFLLASRIRYGSVTEHWFTTLYGMGFLTLILVYVCIFFVGDTSKDIIKRGTFDEVKSVLKSNCILALVIATLLFVLQQGVLYSRFFFLSFIVLNIVIMTLIHLYYKQICMEYFKSSKHKNKLMVVTSQKYGSRVIQKLKSTVDYNTEIVCLAIIDKDVVGTQINGHIVKANKDTMMEFIRTKAVDEVFMSLPNYPLTELEAMILDFESMGVTVNLSINTFDLNVKEKTVQDFGVYHVLTFSTKVFDRSSMIMKRGIDIVGAIVGLMITGVAALFVAPAILIESRGPVIFSQVRIGQNGRRFKIYKFRSMNQNAEAMKEELLVANEMDGLMFKMTDDPRITKVGKFIRKTSIDELPQFLNVLKGEMSLVGTRPPTEDEFLKYDPRHKRRLSLKPGLTGLWQVSGRSDIDNFEEVVKLDLKYIDNWSVLEDIRIILKTVYVVVKGKGSK